MNRLTPRLRRLAAGVALTCAALLPPVAIASADATSDYKTGLALGTQAYQYGAPLLDLERVFKSSTSVTVCNPVTGQGPLNQFCSIRNLTSARERTVNAPNNDTPYSIAWLDLSKQPQVLHAPPIHNRFWTFELVDPWTNNFLNITSAHLKMGAGLFNVTGGGNWAVVGPGFHGKLPRGVIRVNSRYDRVWVVGRTYLRGPQDLGNVHRIQDEYSITPLSKFGTAYKPPRPKKIVTKTTETTIPGTQPGEDPLAFYAALGKEMLKFPAPAADRPLLAQFKTVGIGPGLNPANAHLSADMLSGLRAAVTQGPNNVLSAALGLYLQGFAKHNGYLITDLGSWGTNYTLRAIGDHLGVGGQRASIATYPVALFDDTKAPLTGSKRYVLHIPKSSLPIPAKAFWSLTMYDTNSFFVPNPLNRYELNNRSHLHTNPDGSIDIYIQHDKPSNPAQVSNWLPAPASGLGFRLVWRLYDLDHAVFGVLNGSGWQPPRVQPCDAIGHALDGTACAS
jgi:hypothetical protein